MSPLLALSIPLALNQRRTLVRPLCLSLSRFGCGRIMFFALRPILLLFQLPLEFSMFSFLLPPPLGFFKRLFPSFLCVGLSEADTFSELLLLSPHLQY